MIGIKNQQFGVEIEFTGITRREAAKALADYFQTSPVYVGAGYDTWAVEDSQGRQWKIMSDSSIRAEWKSGDSYFRTTDRSYQVEFVTPVLRYEDMEIFQGLYFRLYRTIHKSASVLQKFFCMFQILRCVDTDRFHVTDAYLYFISILQPAQLFE